MQIGSPPKQPEIKLATASVLVSVVISPKFPSFLYRFPLLSNYSKYKNCSNISTTASMIELGMTYTSSFNVGCLIF